MTDSVRCTADSPNQFSCEVQLDSDFETLTCEAAEPGPPPAAASSSPTPAPALAPSAPPLPPSASNLAVSALVSTFVSRTLVSVPQAPLISGAALLSCASSELSVVLAAAAGKGPILKVVSVFKAALDASSCLTQARNQAGQNNVENYCAGQGGILTNSPSYTPTCTIRERAK